jgi:hypothetical protein
MQLPAEPLPLQFHLPQGAKIPATPWDRPGKLSFRSLQPDIALEKAGLEVKQVLYLVPGFSSLESSDYFFARFPKPR